MSGCRSLARVPAFLGEQLRRVATVQAGNFGGVPHVQQGELDRMPACQPQVLPGVQDGHGRPARRHRTARPFVIGDMPLGHPLPLAAVRRVHAFVDGKMLGVQRGMFFGVAFFDSRTLADMLRAGFLSIGIVRGPESRSRAREDERVRVIPAWVGKMWRYRRR